MGENMNVLIAEANRVVKDREGYLEAAKEQQGGGGQHRSATGGAQEGTQRPQGGLRGLRRRLIGW